MPGPFGFGLQASGYKLWASGYRLWTLGGYGLQGERLQRSDLADRIALPVGVQQREVAFERNLGNATVGAAANGQVCSPASIGTTRKWLGASPFGQCTAASVSPRVRKTFAYACKRSKISSAIASW